LIKKVFLASPRGPCAGVNRALEIIEMAIKKYGTPLYANHEIVHNTTVVRRLEEKGVVFGKNIEEIPDGSVFLYSAHGVSPALRECVARKKLLVIDATCPLVLKVHQEAKKYADKGCMILFVGHAGHPEVEGTMGITPMKLIETKQDAEHLDWAKYQKIPTAVLTQTTLSVDETRQIISILRKKIPHLQMPKASDICYATQNRQDAVKELAKKVDAIVIIGSPKSSNSNRLVETAQKAGCRAVLAESFCSVQESFFVGVEVLGISSGASVPEYIVQDFIEILQMRFSPLSILLLETKKEFIHFSLPEI
jgi:4-hydroxy-3-methylbut-2-en-1-yl diphosphate reductase